MTNVLETSNCFMSRLCGSEFIHWCRDFPDLPPVELQLGLSAGKLTEEGKPPPPIIEYLEGMVHLTTMLISIEHINIGGQKKLWIPWNQPCYHVLVIFCTLKISVRSQKMAGRSQKKMPDYPIKTAWQSQRSMADSLYSHVSGMIFGISEKIPENMPDKCHSRFLG